MKNLKIKGLFSKMNNESRLVDYFIKMRMIKMNEL